MFHVYILQSEAALEQIYTGLADNLQERVAEHNAGASRHTAKYRPWRLLNYTAFVDRERAVAYERYLKTGSGRAFANERLI